MDHADCMGIMYSSRCKGWIKVTSVQLQHRVISSIHFCLSWSLINFDDAGTPAEENNVCMHNQHLIHLALRRPHVICPAPLDSFLIFLLLVCCCVYVLNIFTQIWRWGKKIEGEQQILANAQGQEVQSVFSHGLITYHISASCTARPGPS